MRRTTFFISEDDYDRLTEIAEERGAPLAELIRRAIRTWIVEHDKTQPEKGGRPPRGLQ
jgi:hypothetical protein